MTDRQLKKVWGSFFGTRKQINIDYINFLGRQLILQTDCLLQYYSTMKRCQPTRKLL